MIQDYIKLSINQFFFKDYPLKNDGIQNTIVDSNGCPINPQLIDISEYVNENPSYGQMDKNICIPIHLTQTFDTMGVYTNSEFISNENTTLGDENPYGRMSYLNVISYLDVALPIASGFTNSKLEDMLGYSTTYQIGLNISNDPTNSFDGVLNITPEYVEYVIGGDVNVNGVYIPATGIIYRTYNNIRDVQDEFGNYQFILNTVFFYYPDGRNLILYDLYNIYKDELLFGMVNYPKITNLLQLDRGTLPIMEAHQRLVEIQNTTQLSQNNTIYTYN
jgi:hypothetical protein